MTQRTPQLLVTGYGLDTTGRRWALVAETKPGDLLECDGGFTCLNEGAVRLVQENEAGLFIECAEKQHYLDGQVDGDEGREYYIGLYRSKAGEMG